MMKKDDYQSALKPMQKELVGMARWARATGQRIVVLFEGRDTAGKGGAIKAVRDRLNPRQCRIVALAKPTEAERSQWYFQRYVHHLPCAGEIVLFDRSWYNRAGVEKVMGYADDREVGPHPADPTKPCPFGDLPLDLWEHIAAHLVDSNSTDFVICTTNAVNNNEALPLCPLEQGKRIDHIVRGIPCNGDLYLLEVESDYRAFLGEHHRHGRVLVDDVLGPPDPNVELPEGLQRNGEWYSHIHRDENGKVNVYPTPGANPNSYIVYYINND